MKKHHSFLSFALFVVSVCACVSVAQLISTALVSLNLFTNASLSTEQQTVYAISMASDENENNLQTQKTSLQAQNGAGYVFQVDEKFYLIASIYENKADAELVKNNLATNQISSEILEIKLPSNSVEGNFSNEEKVVLNDCLKSDFEIFKKLYDVAISLDTDVQDLTKAKLECNSIYSSFVSTRVNFETMFNQSSLEDIQTNLSMAETQLSNLINETYETSTQTFSSLIKLTYCKVLLD